MGSAMQLYAGFALLVIALLAIIVIAALVSNLIGAVRRRFGWARAHDDFSGAVRPSRSAGSASRPDKPESRPRSRAEVRSPSRSNDPPVSR
jgi:peptidoglycan/LPS O-acetylase OafA/YrhL